MTFQQSKYVIFIFLFFFSCKKVELNEKASNEFDASGKTFVFYPYGDSTNASVTLLIPQGAVNRIHYVEYNTFIIDPANPLDSAQINYLNNDVHHFQSSSYELLQPALLTIPFRSTINFMLSQGYRPYKIKLDTLINIYDQLNSYDRWTEIISFTFDNTAKTITFEIDDLNACYVLANKL